MSWMNKDVKKMAGNLFRPRSPKEKTMRKAVDFCVMQIVLVVLCAIGIKMRWTTLQMLCILAEIFEWRFFSISLRLRRYEEETEERALIKERRHNA